jgi:hypothetical protein
MNTDTETDNAMVRMRYVGPAGRLDDPRLPGFQNIQPGQAVDVPAWLAPTLIAKAIFVREEDYATWVVEQTETPAPKGGEQSFIEIEEPGGAYDDFSEVDRPVQEDDYIKPGDLPGLGQAKLASIAALYNKRFTWQMLSALDEYGCAAIASGCGLRVTAVAAWRDTAKARLSEDA